jgi:hypothetical protein
MSIKLKGFITGLAEGLGERFDEEREQTKKALATRTNNAYKNYMLYQEQKNALIEEAKKRDARALSIDNTLTDEERIVVNSNPYILEYFEKAALAGKPIALKQMIKLNEEVKGMKFDNYMNTIRQKEASAPMTFQDPTNIFGVSVGRQREMAGKLAGSVGRSLEDLGGFDVPKEAPTIRPMGTIDLSILQKAEKEPKSQEEMLNAARASQTQALMDKGRDSEEYKEAKRVADLIASDIEKPAKTLESEADQLNLAILNKRQSGETTTEEETRLKEVQRAILAHKTNTTAKTPEDTKRGLSQITSSVLFYVNNKMKESMGANWSKMMEESTIKVGELTVPTLGPKQELSPADRQALFTTMRQYARQALKDNGYLDNKGQPLYNNVREFMVNFGLMGAPAPVRTQPSAPPMAGSAAVNIEQERANAKKAIADGANAAAVRARFKERTKQDL